MSVDLGWIVAGVLFLVCLFLMTTVEHAYRTGISEGRIQAIKDEMARLKREP